GVVRNAQGVVQMGVGDEHVRHADDHVGTAADVERDVEIANAEPGLVSGARAPLHREMFGGDGDEVLVAHTRAKARTGKLPTPRNFAGTAKKRKPRAGN